MDWLKVVFDNGTVEIKSFDTIDEWYDGDHIQQMNEFIIHTLKEIIADSVIDGFSACTMVVKYRDEKKEIIYNFDTFEKLVKIAKFFIYS